MITISKRDPALFREKRYQTNYSSFGKYTTKEDEDRSGMGFCFTEAFMDNLEVESKVGQGTKIIMSKYIKSSKDNYNAMED